MSSPMTFLTEAELAERWRCHPTSLANSRMRGTSSVPYVKIGSRVRYPLAGIEAYEAAATVDQRSAAA